MWISVGFLRAFVCAEGLLRGKQSQAQAAIKSPFISRTAALQIVCHLQTRRSSWWRHMRGTGMHFQGTSTGRVLLVRVAIPRPSVAAQSASCRMRGSTLDSLTATTSYILTNVRQWMQVEPLPTSTSLHRALVQVALQQNWSFATSTSH